ncbi:MAG TPA: hypothetical protein VKB51_02105 [bacterium]|nr:hypothetical protein [bacterium]
MEPIRYIEKTHAYYQRKGKTDVYRYAHHTEGPFQRPLKAVVHSRLVLISSAGFVVAPPGQRAPEPYRGINIGQKNQVEVSDVPSDTPAEHIHYVTGAHNRQDSPMSDPDAFFPVTRLRELRAEGRIGSLAPNYLRIRPCYSQRKTRELDAPEVLRRCRAMGVDVALFAPI